MAGTEAGLIFGPAVLIPDLKAGVAELADALDLGSSDASRGGSSPSARTTLPSRTRTWRDW